MRASVAIVCVLLTGCGTSSADLRNTLEAMYESDQSYRVQLQEAAASHGTNSPRFLVLLAKQGYRDWRNARRLGIIVEEHGWPRRSIVGDKAAAAAFLVVQHAGPADQKRYLPMRRSAVEAGEARAQDLALLEDRIRVHDGQKQIYGSQLHANGNGGWEFYPIEDEANVDERRKEVGMSPLSEYANQFGIEYQAVEAQQP